MRDQIVRGELLALLDKGLEYPLTLVVAAPGFGKTTLLNQWQVELEKNNKILIVRFDVTSESESSTAVFNRILNLIKENTSVWDASFFNLFKLDILPSASELVKVLVQALGFLSSNIVIIIDDFHLLQGDLAHQVFCDLIPRLPRHVSIVLSGRMYPHFSLSRLKLEDNILIVDGNDLKISQSDIVNLSLGLCRGSLEEHHATTLLKQTEGWIVGVKLALLAYERSGQPALDTFNGSQPELLNYFGYEVLKNLTEDIKSFVLNSSIFERFNAALYSHVFNPDNSYSVLEKLVEQELFLMPVTNHPSWFRYHALLQDFLQSRLYIERGASYIEQAHRKAADYFIKHGESALAIRHASLSGNDDYYFEVLGEVCSRWTKNGEFEIVIDTLVSLPDALLIEKSFLSISLIYALIFSRRFNQAHYHLELLTDIKSNGESDVDFLKSILQLFSNDTNAIGEANIATFSNASENIEMRGISIALTAYVYLYQGKLELAFKAVHEAKIILSKIGHTFLESYADLIVILCDRYLGRGHEATEYMTTLYEQACLGEKTPVWVNLATGMMVVYYERNQLERAKSLCEELLPMVSYSCATEVVATVYLSFSRLLQLQGDIQKSSRVLNQLDRILSLGKYERFKSHVAQESMRQAIVSQSINAADGLAKKYHLSTLIEQGVWHEGNEYIESNERYGLTIVYWLTLKGRLDRAEDILSQLISMLDRQGLKIRSLIACCNRVVVTYLRGNKDVAVSQLNKLLKKYSLVCFSRSVFDETPRLENVFKYAVDRNRVDLPKVFFDLFEDLISVDGGVSVKPRLVLTEKELQIFELLATGLSNTDISKQIGIALSTTKWHLKNIYNKLGVTNRSGAIMIAHQN